MLGTTVGLSYTKDRFWVSFHKVHELTPLCFLPLFLLVKGFLINEFWLCYNHTVHCLIIHPVLFVFTADCNSKSVFVLALSSLTLFLLQSLLQGR